MSRIMVACSKHELTWVIHVGGGTAGRGSCTKRAAQRCLEPQLAHASAPGRIICAAVPDSFCIFS